MRSIVIRSCCTSTDNNRHDPDCPRIRHAVEALLSNSATCKVDGRIFTLSGGRLIERTWYGETVHVYPAGDGTRGDGCKVLRRIFRAE